MELKASDLQNIIQLFEDGRFCKEEDGSSCYGCCGDNHYDSGCKQVLKNLQKYLEERKGDQE